VPLIACGTGGQIRYYNGSTWVAPSTGITENIWSIIDTTSGSGTAWGACSNGTVIYNTTSSNYNNWATYGPGVTGTSETLLGNVRVFAAGENFLLYVGTNGTILLQDNFPSVSFTVLSSGTTQNLLGCAFNNSSSAGVAVVSGFGGTILRSTAASGYTSWTTQTSGTSADLYRGTYYNGYFYFVGTNGTIIKSADGITWTTLTTGVIPVSLWGILPPVNAAGEPIFGLLYNKGVFPLSGNLDTWYNCKLDFDMTGSNGAGGGGGGGAGSDTIRAGGGGGVGITGTGSSGTGGTFTAGNAGGGTGGSSGATGTAGTGTTTGGLGGNYGAGGGGASRGGSYAGAAGAGGAMKILWGPGRTFPSGT